MQGPVKSTPTTIARIRLLRRAQMNRLSLFRDVWKHKGLAAAIIKTFARIARKRILVEGVDEDFPRTAPQRSLAMPTMEDAELWHTGYGGRWKHVLPLPNERMMLHVGSETVDNFLFVADALAQLLSRYIQPNSHVMDVGCGCGRTARLLVMNPNVERFTGFDVVAPYVAWCNRFFGELYPGRFSFHHVDVQTKRYNPQGTLTCATARFPARDVDVDLIYAASVFTHLYPDDLRCYVREMNRVLKKLGKVIVSIHDRPQRGEAFSGNEHRADYDASYFVQLMWDEGFDLVEDIGDFCGQRTLLLQRKRCATGRNARAELGQR